MGQEIGSAQNHWRPLENGQCVSFRVLKPNLIKLLEGLKEKLELKEKLGVNPGLFTVYRRRQ